MCAIPASINRFSHLYSQRESDSRLHRWTVMLAFLRDLRYSFRTLRISDPASASWRC